MSTQALTVQEYHQEPAVARFQLEQRMARLFVASGLFSDIKGQTEEQAIAQAWVKIGLGASMGFSPAESKAYTVAARTQRPLRVYPPKKGK